MYNTHGPWHNYCYLLIYLNHSTLTAGNLSVTILSFASPGSVILGSVKTHWQGRASHALGLATCRRYLKYSYREPERCENNIDDPRDYHNGISRSDKAINRCDASEFCTNSDAAGPSLPLLTHIVVDFGLTSVDIPSTWRGTAKHSTRSKRTGNEAEARRRQLYDGMGGLDAYRKQIVRLRNVLPHPEKAVSLHLQQSDCLTVTPGGPCIVCPSPKKGLFWVSDWFLIAR